MKCKVCGNSIPGEWMVRGKKTCSTKCEAIYRHDHPRIDQYLLPHEWQESTPTVPVLPHDERVEPGFLTIQKGSVIVSYAKEWGLTTLVETGTAYGEMIEHLRDEFKEIHTIELKYSWFQLAKKHFSRFPHIHLYAGDSSKILPPLLDRLKSPAIFWLDAHFSGGNTVMGDKETPVLEELTAIFNSKKRKHVILIDDLVQFQVNPAYPSIAALRSLVRSYNPKADFVCLAEGMIAITPDKSRRRVQYGQSVSCQIKNLSSIYQREFQGRMDGTFVDVGANDGYFSSNVWGLAVAGWRGLCLEPVPELVEKCRGQYKDYPLVEVLEAAAGAQDGIVTLYLNGNSTINRETALKGPWGSDYDLNDTIQVKGVRLNTLLGQYKIPDTFEVLSIDVEGAELEVLDGIDFDLWHPHLVIIETCKDHPIQSFHFHTEQIINRMQAAGFHEIYADAINSVYLR